jgi:acyl phosphate:glycerol-3-phosphate acyltransferase
MSRDELAMVGLAVLAYLLGSIPFGLLVGLSRGIDPRKAGSGNIGATNVGRLLGGRFFAIVFTLDLLKSLLPMLAAGVVVHASARIADAAGRLKGYEAKTFVLWLLVGLAAILGHMFPVFLKFKGGKGVATSAGVILGLYPFYTYPALIAIGIWLAVFLGWRYVSLASIAGAAAIPAAYVAIGLAAGWPILGKQWPLLLFAMLVAGLVIWRHRGNIARLKAGTEHGFGKARA